MNPSYLKTFTQSFPAETKAGMNQIIDEICTNIRLGRCAPSTRATNAQLYGIEGTTAAVADEEFSVTHGLGRAPYLLIPILRLDQVNQTLPPLTVTRAADAQRVYLSSSVESAPFAALVEG